MSKRILTALQAHAGIPNADGISSKPNNDGISPKDKRPAPAPRINLMDKRPTPPTALDMRPIHGHRGPGV